MTAYTRATSTLGLSLLPRDAKKAAWAALWSVCGVCAFVMVLDIWLFRSRLPESYVSFYTTTLHFRTLAMCIKALGEEITYRLLYMTVIVAAIRIIRGHLTPMSYVFAAMAAQMLGVWPFIALYHVYGFLRFWAVGVVWGLLYWRQGWLVTAGAHVLSHLVLDPLLFIGLAHTA